MRQLNFVVLILLTTYMAVHSEHKGFSLGAGYEMYAIFNDHTENCISLNIGTQLNRHYIGAFVSNDEDWSFFTAGGKYAYYLLQAKYFGAFVSASQMFVSNWVADMFLWANLAFSSVREVSSISEI